MKAKLFLKMFFGATLLALLMSIVPFILDAYGIAEKSCWIKDANETDSVLRIFVLAQALLLNVFNCGLFYLVNAYPNIIFSLNLSSCHPFSLHVLFLYT